MRKKVNHKLEYREEGEIKHITITIDFVSNRILKNFSDLIMLGAKAEKANNRISDIFTIQAGEELTEQENKKLNDELEECENIILEFNNNDYFKKRYEILFKLLTDNGYKNNEMLMSPDFWEENVEPGDLMLFMYETIYKDSSNKKKGQA